MQINLYVNNTTLEASKDMIRSIDNKDLEIEHIIVVPDKYSLQMERLLLEMLPSKALFNVRVLGLTSLANDIFNRLGMKVEVLTAGECLLLTEKAIENVQSRLEVFKHSNISFCYEINKLIAQLKSSGVSMEDLNENAQGMTGAKYHDLALIYNEYQNLLGGKLDANERLALLTTVISESQILSKSKIYFAQFESFTAEGYNLIKTIAKTSMEINISLSRAKSIGNDYIYEDDIFKKLNALSKEIDCKINVVENELSLSPQRQAIVTGLYSYDQITCENKGYYTLYESKNIIEEVEGIAKLIYNRLYNGYKFKDIAVLTSDIQKYQNIIDKTFKKYNFAYYIDSSLTARETLLGNLINLVFETVILGYPNDRLVSVLTNILLGKDDEGIKLCQKKNIDGKYKYKKYLEKHFRYAQIFEMIEKAKTANDFSQVIRDLCEKVKENEEKVLKTLDEKNFIKEKNINNQVREIIENAILLLEKYEAKEIKADEYLKKFNLLMSFTQVSTVPSYVDGILVGDATTSSLLDYKLVIILGSQNLPLTNSDNAILNDEDIKLNYLEKRIEPTIRMINRRNRFKLFNLLSKAENGLIISYQGVNEEGKRNELPAFIDSLNKIFKTECLKMSDVFSVNLNLDNLDSFLLSLGNQKNFIEEHFKDEWTDKFFIEQKNANKVDFNLKNGKLNQKIDKLVFSSEHIRVTQLEQYFSCPFKHYMTYGLKLKEKIQDEFNERDIGNICHKSAEIFLKELMQAEFNFEIDIEKFVNDNFIKILKDENLLDKFEATDEKKSLENYLKNQIRVMLKDIVRDLKSSQFRPLYIEKSFDNIYLGENKLKVVGKADRIDSAGEYFRIIDYKTGKTKNLVKELYYGNKLQLFLYEKAVQKLTNLMPAGALYFNAKFDYAQSDEDKVIFNGLIENDEEIIKLFDENIAIKGGSQILSVVEDEKNGGYKGNAIAKENLSVYEEYAQKIADNAVKEIEEGYIMPKPNDNGCSYCPYFSICQYEKINGVRKQNKMGEIK